MTVERAQAGPPLEPHASMRAELVGQLAAAELALEAVIAELGRNGADAATVSASRLQLSSLISLRQQVGTASGAALAELRAEVVAAASSATALAQQANGNASSTNAPDATARAAAARQTIENVGRDIFDKKVLDPYLQFSSKEDEEAYRKREQERHEAYERAKALGTPEGYQQARQIEQAQLHDAGAHGADRSPEYPKLQSDLVQASIDLGPQPTPHEKAANKSSDAKPSSDEGLDDVLATLSAAGVTTTDKVPSNGHGLNQSLKPSRGQTGAAVQV